MLKSIRKVLNGALCERRARVLAAACSASALLAGPASACPGCSVGQGLDTLIIILCFMGIPYLVVSGVMLWMRRVLAGE